MNINICTYVHMVFMKIEIHFIQPLKKSRNNLICILSYICMHIRMGERKAIKKQG